jgi:hypothetical protein
MCRAGARCRRRRSTSGAPPEKVRRECALLSVAALFGGDIMASLETRRDSIVKNGGKQGVV